MAVRTWRVCGSPEPTGSDLSRLMPVADDPGRPATAMLEVPWLLKTAQLGAHRVSRAAATRGELVSMMHGIWGLPGVLASDADARIAAAALRLVPDCVIGGWAAARLFERATDPDSEATVFTGEAWHEHRGQDRRDLGQTACARVMVCAPRAARLRPGEHARIFRSVVRADEWTVVDGVPVTTPVRTAFDLARLWRQPAAVVALDRLIHLGVVDLTEIRALTVARHRWRGRPSALQVLDRVDGCAESPQESALRMLWLDAGLPRPRCNPVVRDPDGAFVARVDLLDPDLGVVGEYDGAHHASAERRGDDARRQQALEELGLVVVRATAADLATEQAANAWQRRLRRAYRRQRVRPDHVRRWHLTTL